MQPQQVGRSVLYREVDNREAGIIVITIWLFNIVMEHIGQSSFSMSR